MTQRRTITLQEVAEAAGVHVATASRALNAATRSMVNDDTAARVMAAADRLGYRGNSMASGLRTHRSTTVGILVPDLQNPFYPPIVCGIDDELTAHNYFPLVANTNNDMAKEKVVWERLRARQVDGIITATARLQHPLISRAARDGTALVLVSRTVADLNVPAVIFDEEAGMRLAVEHLRQLGHTAIGHVGGPSDLSTGVDRAAAFVAACKHLDIADYPVLTGGALTEQAGEQAMSAMLDAHDVTAVVAANDLMALGCLATIQRRGLSCPRDISLVGVNDMMFLDRLKPPLTSVATPKYEMGRSAAQLLLSILTSDRGRPVETRRLQASLVVRESTSAPRSTRRRRR